jgi:hypothetical protein
LVKTVRNDEEQVFYKPGGSLSSQPLMYRFCHLRIGREGYSSEHYIPISSFQEGLDLAKKGLLFKLISVLDEIF